MARDLRVRRVLTQGAQEQGGHAEHGRSSRSDEPQRDLRLSAGARGFAASVQRVLLLLPPSEGKAPGGRGAPLDLPRLSHPALTPVRERLVAALETAARTDPDGLQAALGCPRRRGGQGRRADDVAARCRRCAATPASSTRRCRTPRCRRPAAAGPTGSLRVASALFGLLAPRDPRAGLPAVGRHVAARRRLARARSGGRCSSPSWRRTGSSSTCGPGRTPRSPGCPHAVQVRVLREADGARTVVSHDNKWTKGLLARALCEGGARSVARRRRGRPVGGRPRRGRRPARRPRAARPRARSRDGPDRGRRAGGYGAASAVDRALCRSSPLGSSRLLHVRLTGWRLPLAIALFVFLSSWLAMALLEPAGSDDRRAAQLLVVLRHHLGDRRLRRPVPGLDRRPRRRGVRRRRWHRHPDAAVHAAGRGHLGSGRSRRMRGEAALDLQDHLVLLGYAPGRSERIVAELTAEGRTVVLGAWPRAGGAPAGRRDARGALRARRPDKRRRAGTGLRRARRAPSSSTGATTTRRWPSPSRSTTPTPTSTSWRRCATSAGAST